MGDPQRCSHSPSMSSSPGRPAPRLAGDAKKEKQWLSASRNSQSERRNKMYICKAMNSSIIIGTAQMNIVKNIG